MGSHLELQIEFPNHTIEEKKDMCFQDVKSMMFPE